MRRGDPLLRIGRMCFEVLGKGLPIAEPTLIGHGRHLLFELDVHDRVVRSAGNQLREEEQVAPQLGAQTRVLACAYCRTCIAGGGGVIDEEGEDERTNRGEGVE